MPDIQVAAHKSDGAKSMKNVKYGWLIFALIMLFNPNLQLIDILPDFIGFFILAKFIERAADAAPYFEEARAAFVKLGYISLAKIPALFVIVLVRSKNTLDNDIIALFAEIVNAFLRKFDRLCKEILSVLCRKTGQKRTRLLCKQGKAALLKG